MRELAGGVIIHDSEEISKEYPLSGNNTRNSIGVRGRIR